MAGETPQEQLGMIQRAIAGAKRWAFGAGTLTPTTPMPELTNGPFAPGVPIGPTLSNNDGSEVDARRWDYPTAWNLGTIPRAENSNTRPFRMTADDLRLLSRSYGLLREVIETRKNQVVGQAYNLRQRREPEIVPDLERVRAARKLWKKPDGRTPFQGWLQTLLEDLLVIDQIAIRVDPNKAGVPIAFRAFDPATVKLLIDLDGETPMAPLPAYMQMIKGLPASWFTTQDLIVRSFNPSTDWPYGYSAVEQIADIVAMGLRRQQHQLNFYTEGNLPESLIVAPEGWDKKVTAKFQIYWDMLFEGPNALQLKRKTRFLPHGMDVLQTKDPVLKDEMDDWLARQICYAFNVSPSALTKDNNRSVGETIHEQNQREGLIPLLNWLKELFDDVLERAGFGDVEFVWAEEDSLDPLERAQVDQIYSTIGAKSINEIRAGIGLAPIPGGDTVGPKPPAGPTGGGSGMQAFMTLLGKRGYSEPGHIHKSQKKKRHGTTVRLTASEKRLSSSVPALHRSLVEH